MLVVCPSFSTVLCVSDTMNKVCVCVCVCVQRGRGHCDSSLLLFWTLHSFVSTTRCVLDIWTLGEDKMDFSLQHVFYHLGNWKASLLLNSLYFK